MLKELKYEITDVEEDDGDYIITADVVTFADVDYEEVFAEMFSADVGNEIET